MSTIFGWMQPHKRPLDLWSDLKLMAARRSIAGTLRKGAELPGGKGRKAEKDENQAGLRDTDALQFAFIPFF